MASIESIKTDVSKEVEGVWVNYGSGIKLLIARARNSKYQDVLRELIDPLKKGIREDSVKITDLEDVLLRVRARTILLGWKNIEAADGSEIVYSHEAAEKFFKDPELRDFYIFVVTVSESADRYKKELVEAAEKN